jgi:hypothetical protein
MDPRDRNPTRVQLRRSKGWRMPPGTVKVDRTTVFGNPFPQQPHGREASVRMYRLWLQGKLPVDSVPARDVTALRSRRTVLLKALFELEGKNLACWCPLPEAGQPDICHAAILLDAVRKSAARRRRGR